MHFSLLLALCCILGASFALEVSRPRPGPSVKTQLELRQAYAAWWAEFDDLMVELGQEEASEAEAREAIRALFGRWWLPDGRLIFPMVGVDVTGVAAIVEVALATVKKGLVGEYHTLSEPLPMVQDGNTVNITARDTSHVINKVTGLTSVYLGSKTFSFERQAGGCWLISQALFEVVAVVPVGPMVPYSRVTLPEQSEAICHEKPNILF
ncbi:hypothetical protein QOT17_004595 [Balamuthia mandrillaris]